jgi:predicted enzyme related to lactoylglutathione lyase
MGITRVHNAHLFVTDMDRAVEFYRDQLGLEMRFTNPFWSEFLVDGFPIGLQYIGAGQVPGGSGATIDFEVTDIEDVIGRLKTHGTEFVAEVLDQPFGKLAKFRDPDGNLLGLFEQTE